MPDGETEMKPAGGRKTSEIVKCWRSPCLPDVDLLHAHYTAQSFSRHAHDGYAVGVIEQGALSFSYRGGTWIAPAGQINLAVPGEAHTGTGVNGLGWTYRMFYLPPERLHQVTTEITGRPGYFPFFAAGVINDLQLAGQIQKLHKALEENETSRLEQEEGLLALLTSLVLHYAEPRQGLRDPGREPSAVKHALEYLEAHYAENLSIQDLAGLCHLSPYYFIRSFTAQVGVSPHAYHQQVRVRQARKLLEQGCPATFVAQESGFVDQSHFSRRFRQITGMSPGQYRNFVQSTGRLRNYNETR